LLRWHSEACKQVTEPKRWVTLPANRAQSQPVALSAMFSAPPSDLAPPAPPTLAAAVWLMMAAGELLVPKQAVGVIEVAIESLVPKQALTEAVNEFVETQVKATQAPNKSLSAVAALGSGPPAGDDVVRCAALHAELAGAATTAVTVGPALISVAVMTAFAALAVEFAPVAVALDVLLSAESPADGSAASAALSPAAAGALEPPPEGSPAESAECAPAATALMIAAVENQQQELQRLAEDPWGKPWMTRLPAREALLAGARRPRPASVLRHPSCEESSGWDESACCSRSATARADFLGFPEVDHRSAPFASHL